MTVSDVELRRGAVGVSVPRADAPEKLRGQAQFAGDLLAPRMLHGKVLRSPVAHARIVSIDTRAAEAMPQVVCVLTGADLGDIHPYWGHSIKDRPVLALGKVRFPGDPVAAVAAETEEAAEAAVLAIRVEYEELPVAGTLDEALAPGAPLVHEGPQEPGLFHGLGQLPERDGNVCYRYGIERERSRPRSRTPPTSSKAATRSRASISTRSRRTRCSRRPRTGRSRFGPPASIRFSCGQSLRRSSSSRSHRCA